MLASPVVGWWISRPLAAPVPGLSVDQQAFLRAAARRTWRYFADFVGPQDNWLPPDNFQERPEPAIASRLLAHALPVLLTLTGIVSLGIAWHGWVAGRTADRSESGSDGVTRRLARSPRIS